MSDGAVLFVCFIVVCALVLAWWLSDDPPGRRRRGGSSSTFLWIDSGDCHHHDSDCGDSGDGGSCDD